MTRRSPLVAGVAALVLALAPSALSQTAPSPRSMADLIISRWPGDTIAKASEAEFEAFAKASGVVDVEALRSEFLDRQWRFFGFDRPEGRESFASPRQRRPLPRLRASTSFAAVPEGPEPNTDPNGFLMGTPTPIQCADLGEGSIFPVLDSDWWAVSQPETGRFVAFCGPGAFGAITDPVLTLRDASGAILLVNDDFPGRGRYSVIDIDLPVGSYFLEVTGFGNVRTGSYSLDILCGEPATVDPSSVNVVEFAEPNDSIATATPTDCNDVISGSIGSVGDSDWFRFETAGLGPVLGTTSAGGGGNPIADTVLTLRDASGAVLLTVDDFAGPFATLFSTIPAGIYYWEVSGGSGATGTYELMMTCSGGALIEGEAPEPNDSAATSTPLACGDFAMGQIASSADADWWEVRVLRRSTLNLSVTAPLGSPLLQGRLTLLDETGGQLAQSTGPRPGVLASVSETVFAGRYFAIVEGNAGATGNYQFSVGCAVPSAPSGASFDVTASTCTGSEGVPTIVPRPLQLPYLGSSFPIDVENLIPGTIAALNLGFSDVVAVDGSSLPLDLGPLGAVGCSLDVSSEVVIPLTVDVSGGASHVFRIPNSFAFDGLELFFQPVSVDSMANPLGLAFGTTATLVTGPLQ